MYYSLLIFILSIFIIIILLYKANKYKTELEFKIPEVTPKGRNFFPWLLKTEIPVEGEIIVRKSGLKKWELIALFLSSISAICSIADFVINRMGLIIRILKG